MSEKHARVINRIEVIDHKLIEDRLTCIRDTWLS